MMLDTVRAAAPDVLALTECRSFHDDDRARLRLFERELGLTGVINTALTGNHIAILHRPDHVVSGVSDRAITMLYALVRIVVQTPGLGPVSGARDLCDGVSRDNVPEQQCSRRRLPAQRAAAAHRGGETGQGRQPCLDPGRRPHGGKDERYACCG